MNPSEFEIYSIDVEEWENRKFEAHASERRKYLQRKRLR
jgi:hypothetical protein